MAIRAHGQALLARPPEVNAADRSRLNKRAIRLILVNHHPPHKADEAINWNIENGLGTHCRFPWYALWVQRLTTCRIRDAMFRLKSACQQVAQQKLSTDNGHGRNPNSVPAFN